MENKQETIARLQAEGLSAKEISEKTGIPYGTVYYNMRRGEKAGMGPNADRKKCKTCQYRGIKNGCDYIEIVGHSRGCSVESCTVYKKGARQEIKKTASDRIGV